MGGLILEICCPVLEGRLFVVVFFFSKTGLGETEGI